MTAAGHYDRGRLGEPLQEDLRSVLGVQRLDTTEVDELAEGLDGLGIAGGVAQ